MLESCSGVNLLTATTLSSHLIDMSTAMKSRLKLYVMLERLWKTDLLWYNSMARK